jgi:hypothetical protein
MGGNEGVKKKSKERKEKNKKDYVALAFFMPPKALRYQLYAI